MDKVEFRLWAARISELEEDQVQDLYRRLKMLGKAPLETSTEADDWLLHGICSAMRLKALVSNASLPTLLRGDAAKGYYKIAATLKRDLEQLLPPANKSAARTSLAMLVGNSIMRLLEDRKIPVTASNVLRNTGQATVALDHAFPGYIEANLFHLVLSGALHAEAKQQTSDAS